MNEILVSLIWSHKFLQLKSGTEMWEFLLKKLKFINTGKWRRLSKNFFKYIFKEEIMPNQMAIFFSRQIRDVCVFYISFKPTVHFSIVPGFFSERIKKKHKFKSNHYYK